jgi:hypothetical protein
MKPESLESLAEALAPHEVGPLAGGVAMIRHLWTVPLLDGDLTVIAETADDALQCAIESCQLDPEDDDEYDDARDGVRVSRETGLRWVQLESEGDRDAQVSDLKAAGVRMARIRLRTWSRPGEGADLFEVGCRDADWCRLPCGVLCGGGE